MYSCKSLVVPARMTRKLTMKLSLRLAFWIRFLKTSSMYSMPWSRCCTYVLLINLFTLFTKFEKRNSFPFGPLRLGGTRPACWKTRSLHYTINEADHSPFSESISFNLPSLSFLLKKCFKFHHKTLTTSFSCKEGICPYNHIQTFNNNKLNTVYTELYSYIEMNPM